MSEIEIGTLYDMNKELMKTAKPLDNKEINKQLVRVKDFFSGDEVRYYMLLSKERSDYTVFRLKNSLSSTKAIKDLKECLNNRGEILSIEKTEDNVAFEIWLRIDGENFVYYLFRYDFGVIEA